jgi:hypothetical protein
LYFNPSNGNLTAGGSITAYSDERIKENISQISNALENILKISGVTYTRKDTGKFGRGLLAQNVQEVYPELVDENKDNGLLSVAYAHLMGDVVEAIRELDNRQKQKENTIVSNGKWSMISGEDGDDEDLFVINNKTGKKYKFSLKEV